MLGLESRFERDTEMAIVRPHQAFAQIMNPLTPLLQPMIPVTIRHPSEVMMMTSIRAQIFEGQQPLASSLLLLTSVNLCSH